MALQKPNGEYIAITQVESNAVYFRIYRNAKHRKDEKEWVIDRFQVSIPYSVWVTIDYSSYPDNNKSLHDNIKRVAYEQVKTMEEFADCIDV